MDKLGRFNKVIFKEKISGIEGVDESDLDTICIFWQQIEKYYSWVLRFKAVVGGLSVYAPEKEDAQKAFSGCEALFDEIQTSLVDLLSMPPSPDENYFFRIWVRPILSIVGKGDPRVKMVAGLAESINRFRDSYETDENDQIIAASEVLLSSPNPDNVRMKVAQWGFEELMRNLKIYELNVKVGGIEVPSTIDDLETEKIELSDAIRYDPWSAEKLEAFRKIFDEFRKDMDLLDFETEVKTGYNRAFDYATGSIGKSVSAIDILRNIESVWQGIQDDSTLQEFWENEQEELEDSIENK